MVAVRLKQVLDKKKITIYKLAKASGIKYELLRRVFAGERKLTADELILILECTNTEFDEIK